MAEQRVFNELIDITEETNAAEALRKSEEFGRLVLMSSQDFIAVLDDQGRIVKTNGWSERLPGIDDAALLGAEFTEIWRGEDLAAARQALVNARVGRPESFEGIFLPGDGAPRWWNVAINLLGEAPSRPYGYLIVARDITERRRRIEERYAAIEEEALLGRLAGAVAHQVNNPLFAIRMQVASLAKILPQDEKVGERIALILEQTDRIERTTRALVGLARRRQGGRERADLAAMIRGLLLLYETGLTAQGIRCEVALPETLPLDRCETDRMQQAFIGLIEYARQSLVQGGHLSLRGASEKGAIEITVEHDGKGLGEQPELVFAPLSLLVRPGAGLSTVQRTIEMHGGSIEAENRAKGEGGARIRIRLPIGGLRGENAT